MNTQPEQLHVGNTHRPGALANDRSMAVLARSLLLALLAVTNNAAKADVVWAVNVGGPAYVAVDGTSFAEEESVSGGSRGTVDAIRGSHDAFLYQSYREGDIEITKPLANGSYDVTLHFAEPDEIASGDRLFDVLIQGQPVIRKLDVTAFRDGKNRSALTMTFPGIHVQDGQLNLRLEPSTGLPVLAGVVVRARQPISDDWKLVWNDEFEVDGPPDPSRWNLETWPARLVNDEDQAYTARAKNVRVRDGLLIIEAHKEEYDDAAYTSGRLQSSGKGDFKYGRFEARARVPAGKGTWAAIWMLPSNPFTYATTCDNDADWQGSETCDAWPNSGEIDILEHVGYQMGHIHGTVHNKAYYWINWQQRKGRILLDDVDERFHTYAVEWTPERIDAFVDDTLYFSYVNEHADWQSWPYDQPFHMILNLAIGGAWGRAGGGIADEIFPVRMEVDYVRIYQAQSD